MNYLHCVMKQKKFIVLLILTMKFVLIIPSVKKDISRDIHTVYCHTIHISTTRLERCNKFINWNSISGWFKSIYKFIWAQFYYRQTRGHFFRRVNPAISTKHIEGQLYAFYWLYNSMHNWCTHMSMNQIHVILNKQYKTQ